MISKKRNKYILLIILLFVLISIAFYIINMRKTPFQKQNNLPQERLSKLLNKWSNKKYLLQTGSIEQNQMKINYTKKKADKDFFTEIKGVYKNIPINFNLINKFNNYIISIPSFDYKIKVDYRENKDEEIEDLLQIIVKNIEGNYNLEYKKDKGKEVFKYTLNEKQTEKLLTKLLNERDQFIQYSLDLLAKAILIENKVEISNDKIENAKKEMINSFIKGKKIIIDSTFDENIYERSIRLFNNDESLIIFEKTIQPQDTYSIEDIPIDEAISIEDYLYFR